MNVEIKIPFEKRESVVNRVHICVDCGSNRTKKNYYKMKCPDCGSVRYIVDPKILFETSPE